MNYDVRLQSVADKISSWVEAGEVPGTAVAVAQGGRQVWEHYAGLARDELPSGESVLWPLASISKLYTAAMVMALVERGELTLGMTVESTLPKFSGGGKDEVTLRHLLTHTSGVIYESPVHTTRLQALTPYQELIDEAYLYPLMFRPGAKLSYSDYGYALAGRVAETVTGVDYSTLVDELVLAPLDLAETMFRPSDEQRNRTAHVAGTYADGTPGAMYNSSYALNLAHPAFGAIASARDLLSFGSSFTTNGRQFLSDAAVREMTSDQTGGGSPAMMPGFLDSSVPVPWGLGFWLPRNGSPFKPDLLPEGSYGHGGASGCSLWIDPVDDIVVAYVSNKHALTGRPPFTRRLVTVMNMVTAALTRC